MSKNNFNERLRKMQPKQDHYSIRKFTVGAASVLIGISFLGMTNSQNVKADVLSGQSDVEEAAKKDQQENDSSSEQKNNTENSDTQNKNDNQNKQPVIEKKTAASDEAKAKVVSKGKAKAEVSKQDSEKTNPNNEAGEKASTSKQKIDLQSGDELVEKDNNAGSSSNKEKSESGNKQTFGVGNFKGKTSRKEALMLGEEKIPDTSTAEVSDWNGLAKAMENTSINTINLTGDITVTGKIDGKGTNPPVVSQPNPVVNSGKLNLGGTAWFKTSATNIARNLTINGNGHALNFGKYYISFTTNNQSNGTPWNLVIKNVTINADGRDSGTYAGAFSPFYMGGDDIDTKLLAKNKVTFDNVKADIKNGAFYTTTMAKQAGDDPYTTVTFEGDNSITCENINPDVPLIVGVNNFSSAVMASHIIFANGTTTTFKVGTTQTHGQDLNAGGNILRAKIEDSKDTEAPIIVEKGATVNLKATSNDVRGILTNKGLDGTVIVNGTLNANMQKGHSSAIWAGSLEIGNNGTVKITTQQDNKNDGDWGNGVRNYYGTHFAPISLGVGVASNVTSADSHLTDNGTLKIVRNNTGKTLVPLIAFGSGGVNASKYNLTVGDSATLDLEDNSTTFDSVQLHKKQPNTPPAGMITMFGTSSNDSLTLDNPGYVNLQRTGSLRGNFIRLEGTTNSAWLNGSSSNAVTPIAQWDEAETNDPSFVWYINQLHTQNQWGDYANSYTTKGQDPAPKKGSDTLLNATDNSFTMAVNQAGKGSTGATNGEINSIGDTGVGYKTDYVNQFGNHFSWWLPQRLAMGSKLSEKFAIKDSDRYQPETKIIHTDTSHKLSDLIVQDGIKDLIGPDGIASYNGIVDWTRTTWISKSLRNGTDGTGALVSNQSGNFPNDGKYTALANIYYMDGSHDDNVLIQIDVGSKEADTYEGHYKGITVKEGQPGHIDSPTFTRIGGGPGEPAGNIEYLPVTNGTDQTPSWVTVNSDGSLKLNTTDAPIGMTNIPVNVKYDQDGSSEIIYAPVYVQENEDSSSNNLDHQIIWGHDSQGNTIGAVVLITDPSKLNAHETSAHSQVLKPADAVSGIEEYTVAENGKATLVGHLDKSKVKISWINTDSAPAPSTIVGTPTQSKLINGTIHVDWNGQVNTYLGKDANTSLESKLSIPMVGATAKNPSPAVSVGAKTELTQDQFNKLIDNNIPSNEITSYAWHNADGTDTLTTGVTTATIRITFKDKYSDGDEKKPTYLDIELPANSFKVNSDSDEYSVSYHDLNIERPNDDATNSNHESSTTNAPDDAISNYDIDSSFTNPTGVTISVDQSGEVTVEANKTAHLGSFKVPVNVTYADGSTKKVDITVSIIGADMGPHGGETHYYGDQTMLTFGLPVITVHKTTGTNIYDATQIKFDTIYYYYNWSGQGYDKTAYKHHKIYDLSADRTKYVNEDDHADTFNASDLHTSWRTVGGYTYQADTDESKFSDGTATIYYRNADDSINSTGAKEEQTAVGGTLPENLAGNSKYRFNFYFDGDAPSGIKVPAGIWSNVYFNFLGATGKTDILVNVGDTVPTDTKTLKGYLKSYEVGLPSNVSAQSLDATKKDWTVTRLSWETNGEPGTNGKFDASHLSGIVRFDFKDKNGNTSYLDVPVSFVVNGGNPGGNGDGGTPKPNPNPKPDDNGDKKPKPGDNTRKTSGKKTPKPGKGKDTGHKKPTKPGKGGNKGGHKKPTKPSKGGNKGGNRKPGNNGHPFNGKNPSSSNRHPGSKKRNSQSINGPVKGQKGKLGPHRNGRHLTKVGKAPEGSGLTGRRGRNGSFGNGPETLNQTSDSEETRAVNGQSSQNNSQQRKTLPQTGQKHNNAVVLSALGLAVAGIAALLIMAGDRKRNN